MKISASFTLLFTSLILYGCQTGMGEKPFFKPLILSAEQTEIVKEGIKNSLKDPISASFGPMKAAETDKKGISHVCGTVNAKNSFGGYSGQRPYVGVLGIIETEGKTIGVFSVTDLAVTKRDAEVVVSMCKHYGVF